MKIDGIQYRLINIKIIRWRNGVTKVVFFSISCTYIYIYIYIYIAHRRHIFLKASLQIPPS
jgi:hypothetical protein